MKKTFLTILVISLSNLIFAQSQANSVERRYIEVTGSAEVVVSPDEIELTITLMEYSESKNNKVDLNKIESKFMSILKKHNIDKSKLIFGNSDYYWYYWWIYRNDDYKRKTFKVKLNSSTDFLSLVKDLDYRGVISLRISNSSNRELQKLRKQVKISALKAAKEKAMYLLESIDEQIGKVISIQEITNGQNYYWRRNQNLMSNAVISSNSNSEDFDNVATIKMRYEVKAKFEIK